SSLTGSTHVRLSARYWILPSTFGKVAFETCDHDHEWSCISLLKVTLISVSDGSTAALPASGVVFTTTGRAVSTVISSEWAIRLANPQPARTSNSVWHFIEDSGKAIGSVSLTRPSQCLCSMTALILSSILDDCNICFLALSTSEERATWPVPQLGSK